MPGTSRYRHRQGMLPGVVASAVSYQSEGLLPGAHRGLPSPWITFIVSVDGPVRVSGTVEEARDLRPDAATSYDVIVAGLHPVAALVEQPTTRRASSSPSTRWPRRGCSAAGRPSSRAG